MGYSSWSLEKRFAVLSLITFLFLGTTLVWGNVVFVKRQLVGAAARYSEGWVNSLIRQHFNDKYFVEQMTVDQIRKTDDFFLNNVISGEIKRVKVWNRGGRIVYSDEKSVVNKVFPISDHLHRALNGETTAEFTTMSEEEQQTEKQIAHDMLEVYVPIFSGDHKTVLGSFELYIHDLSLARQLSYNYRVIIVSTIASLAALYLTLMGIFRRASSTISNQSREIGSLYQNLDQSLKWQEKAQTGTIKALLTTLNAKDNYTAGHSLRVAEYALQIGRAMDLPEEKRNVLREAALFHDIGKIGITESILNKPGKFSDEEYELMKKHPVIGSEIVSSFDHLQLHAEIVRHHHERIDGSGYPDGIKGSAISLESRILAVADTFDALTTNRPYRRGMSTDQALNIIRDVSGTQLDGKIVTLFLQTFDNKT